MAMQERMLKQSAADAVKSDSIRQDRINAQERVAQYTREYQERFDFVIREH